MSLRLGLTRQQLLDATTSADLTAYYALLLVHQEEAEMERHRLESKDGQVFIQGRDDDGDDDGD